MKFKLSDFVELDTKGLLAVNGGYYCNGSSNTTVYSNPYYSGNSGGGKHGGGGYGDTSGKTGGGCGRSITPKSDDTSGEDTNSNQPIETVVRETGKWEFYPDGSGIWTDTSGVKHPFGPVDHTKDNENSQPSTENPQTVTVNGSGGGTCNGASSSSDQVTTTVTTGEPVVGGSSSGGSTGNSSGTNGDNASDPSEPQTPNTPGQTEALSSGKFGQITDGSYADNLTMQYYIKDFPWTNGEIIDSFMNGTYIGTDGKEHTCKFSLLGCKEIGSAMMGSEFLGENVSPMTIQNSCDLDGDGNLSAYEIATGLNSLLDDKYGDIYDIQYEDIVGNIDLNKLEQISNKNDTYVLGFAQNCHGGHWVVLEGYSQDSSGKITFNYDETSSNDIANNRTFVLGFNNESVSTETYAITRIQTFTRITK